MVNDNTKPEFFEGWSKEALIIECARLNQVLKDCVNILDSVSTKGGEDD